MNQLQYRRRHVSVPIALLLAGFMTACSTPPSGMREVETPFRLGSPPPSIAVTITPPGTGMSPSLLNEIIGATVAALRETRRFARVVSTTASVGGPVDLRLEINLVSTNEVTPGARLFAGVFAGAGNLKAEVRIFDALTARVVGKAVVSAKTSGGSSFAGTSSEAVDPFTEQIVEFVLGR